MRLYFVPLLVALLGALMVSMALTPLVRALAVRWGAIDNPSARKVHISPIPRLGGLAIWIALWSTALLVVRFLPGDRRLAPPASLPELAGIFAGATIILIVGMTDDRRGELTPFAKLAGQVAACAVLVCFGLRLQVFDQPWIDLPLTFLWVLGLTNALNLLDNMDGLSAGATSIAGAFFLVLAGLNGQILVALLAAALVGACLGFLVYNYNPASIFMGDTGSLSLGFMLAVLGMKLQIHNEQNLSFVIAALVLSVPIFDTAFVVWRRVSEGRRITQGGKDHTSHRLVKLGLNQKQAVWVLYGLSFLGGLTALLVSQGSMSTFFVLLVLFLVVVVSAGWFLSRVEVTAAG
ncbi:MAG TPA: MraY family glycosyltransferase [Chloroflexota bacterium]|nr:MraY family glycosyltransferase [Chloroflexota bacterium]